MNTIEQKAKAYDEIIERAKTMLAAGEVMYGKENNASQLITDLIPELRESEDEKIIEEIRFAVMQMPSERQDTKNRCFAWLEKQKEQKVSHLHPEDYPMAPGECIKSVWSEEDENNLNKLLQWDGIPLGLRRWVSGLPEKVGTRPSWKPTEEQMEALEESLMSVAYTENKTILESLLKQLKKL